MYTPSLSLSPSLSLPLSLSLSLTLSLSLLYRIRRVWFRQWEDRDRHQDQPRWRSQPRTLHAPESIHHRHENTFCRRSCVRLLQAPITTRSTASTCIYIVHVYTLYMYELVSSQTLSKLPVFFVCLCVALFVVFYFCCLG